MKKSIFKTVHDSAKGLQKAGLIDKNTMRKFDMQCLSPVNDFTPRQIKNLRTKEKVSQPVFANYLNISPSTVKQWEKGDKHPRGTSLKLLNIIAKKGLKFIA
jgi:putative transcriptional regulator